MTFDPRISEWDNPIGWRPIILHCSRLTQGTETSEYLQEKKINNASPSSGERTGNSPNQLCYGIIGVVGPRFGTKVGEWNDLESSVIDGDNPVHEAIWTLVVSWVARSTRNSAWICRDHPVRLNTPERPIANQYCEGKVKSTSNRRVK